MSDISQGISIVLSVYNGGDFLKESIDSVLSQTYPHFELLIMDDCSTDESWLYLSGINDKRIKLYRQEKNRGLFPCLNELIAKTNPQFPLIKLWSQDDVMNPDCLQEFVRFYIEHPHLGFTYSDRETINEKGKTIPSNYIDNTPAVISPDLHARIALYTGSIAGNIANVCLYKPAIERVGLFHEEMHIAADFDMWSRIARNHSIGFINQKLVKLREHRGQLSRNRDHYVRVPKEDMEVYNYILSYVSPELREEGIQNLHKFKFVYYYTLMIKAFLRLKVKTGWSFFKHLYSFGSFRTLTYNFIKSKLKAPPIPDFVPRRPLNENA